MTAAPNPAAYFDAVYDAFTHAAGSTGNAEPAHASVRHYCIAGVRVTVRFAGERIAAAFMPTLSHLLTTPHGAPDLTVCVWDGASAAVIPPRPPWRFHPRRYSDDYGTQGEIRGFNDARFGAIHHQWFQHLHLIDRARGLAIAWYADARDLPYWEAAFPLRPALHLYSRDLPLQLMHSAAVGTVRGGVLIAGKSGTGKSTTALACAGSALKLAGDDYTAVRLGETPYVHSLYRMTKLVPENKFSFPHLKGTVLNPSPAPNEKKLVLLDESMFTDGFPLTAILIPQITGERETRILPGGSRAAALFALAPATQFQLIAHKPIIFRKLTQLVKRVPVYRLELGTDLAQIPEAILSVIP